MLCIKNHLAEFYKKLEFQVVFEERKFKQLT